MWTCSTSPTTASQRGGATCLSRPCRPPSSPTYDRPYYRSVDWTVIVGILGILGTLAAALGTRWFDFRHQDRIWHRDQRVEAHHAFLNRVNRMIQAVEAVTHATPGADPDALETNFREAQANTVDAYNRIDLVATPETRDLAAQVLSAADPERLFKPAEFEGVVRAIGEASRIYREAARAELSVRVTRRWPWSR